MKKTIGFVGLGNMGSVMCKNLLEKDYTIFVWDIRQDVMRSFEQHGAAVPESYADFVRNSDIILLSLPGPEEVKEAVIGEQGILAYKNQSQDITIFDFSTIDPITSKTISETCKINHVTYIDAPVSGGVAGARNRKLTFIIGAEKQEIAPFEHLLKDMGSTIFCVGKRGNGTSLKLINNMMAMCNAIAVSEGAIIAAKQEIPLNTFYQIVSNSSGNSHMLHSMIPKASINSHDHGFSIDLAHKDLELASSLCKKLKLPIFFSNNAEIIFRMAQSKGGGSKDVSYLVPFYENFAGVEIDRCEDSE